MAIIAEGELEISSVDVAMISQRPLFPLTVMDLFAGKIKIVGTREPRKVRLGYAWVLELFSRISRIK